MKELKLENKYIYLAFAAGLLYYAAYYLKFPNSYSAIISLFMVSFLAMGFKKTDGLKVIICSLIISLMTLASSAFSTSLPITYQMMVFSINLVILLLMIFGLKSLRKWGYYLSIAIFSVSIINLILVLVGYNMTYFSWSIQGIAMNLKNVLSLAFAAASITFLIRFRKSFN